MGCVNNAKSPQTELQSIISAYAYSGMYTACYAECGFLRSGAPIFRSFIGCEPSSIFDLASLSKALVLGPIAFRLAKVKSIRLEDQLGDLIPKEKLHEAMRQIKLIELLQHQSGLPAWRNFWINRIFPDSKEADLELEGLKHLEKVFSNPFGALATKGIEQYSDVGMLLLYYIIVVAFNQPLYWHFKSMKKKISPHWTGFCDRGSSTLIGNERVVPTSFCLLRKRLLRGEVHDENSFSLGAFTGHAGLFASGEGLSEFIKKAYNSTFYSNYFAANAELLARSDHGGLIGLRRGIDSGSVAFANGKSMGHLGFTGTGFWIDPIKETYAILLTNRVISGRVSSKIQPFRASCLQLMSQILGYR